MCCIFVSRCCVRGQFKGCPGRHILQVRHCDPTLSDRLLKLSPTLFCKLQGLPFTCSGPPLRLALQFPVYYYASEIYRVTACFFYIFHDFPLHIVGVFFSIPIVVQRVFRRKTRYIVGTHDMWQIVVEIRRGKYDSTSWIGTQHTHILCNRFKKNIACF